MRLTLRWRLLIRGSGKERGQASFSKQGTTDGLGGYIVTASRDT